MKSLMLVVFQSRRGREPSGGQYEGGCPREQIWMSWPSLWRPTARQENTFLQVQCPTGSNFPEGFFAGALANIPRIIEVNLIPCLFNKLGWVILEVLPAPVFCFSVFKQHKQRVTVAVMSL